MAEDLIRYDILVQDALRGVIRKVLAEVAHTGLPGEHHFFITFATTAPGVRMSTRLLARFPEEMSIILQHQYWDLTVSETAFEVSLSFGGVRERLHVPFSAIKGFQDRGVPFALQFGPQGVVPPAEEPAPPIEAKPSAEAMPPLPAPGAAASVPAETPKVEKTEGSAEVVRLDTFRKKN